LTATGTDPATPSPATRRAPVFGRSLTAWSLAALVVGLAAGILLHGSTNPWVKTVAEAANPVGQLWVRSLQVTVIPLVITHLLSAIMGSDRQQPIGALGGKALILFIGMLIAAGLFAILVASPLVALYSVDPETASSLRASTSVPASALEAARQGETSLGEWLVGLVPSNIFAAAASGEVLPLLLFTVLFGLAATRLPPEPREQLARTFRALGEAMMVLIRWILVATPIGVLVLTFEMTLGVGLAAAGFLTAFVLLVSGVLLLFTALLYPVSGIMGRTSIRAFARAAAPAQLVAVSTRSSLASLPALVQGARQHLQLSATMTGFVLPLSVSTFKVNRTISSTTKLLFLAHVFDVPLGAPELATFLVSALILSFSSVGVPGGGSAFRTLPAYLAAGVPIEGIVILEAVDTIPDIFKTLTNVTGDMSAATILSRTERATVKASLPVAATAPAVGASEGAS
jgi:proton glutamate symport protein